MAHNRNWIGYSLDRLIAAAGTTSRTDPQAEALSNRISQLHPDVAPRQKLGCASYWLPQDRAMARALTAGGAASAGGDLIAGVMVGALVEAARPASILQRAGAQVIDCRQGAGEFVIPNWSESASGAWLAEGEDASQASLSVATSSATPRLLASRIGISRRLILQSIAPIEDAILSELSRSNLAVMEQGFWNGSGSNSEPLGIVNLPNLQTQSFAAAVPTYAELVAMVATYLAQEASFERMTFFTNPQTLAGLMTQEVSTGTGQFVAACIHGPRQFSLFGVPVLASSAIPEGKVILADPTRIAIVYWNAPQLLIDRYTNGKSISGAAEVIIHNAVDIVATRPSEIVVGSN
jgi:HK97 family phage major capsid protein